MTTPLMPGVTSSKPLRKRVLLQDLDLVTHIMGIFDPSIHELKPEMVFLLGGVVRKAKHVKVTTRAIWYREVPTEQEPTQ